LIALFTRRPFIVSLFIGLSPPFKELAENDETFPHLLPRAETGGRLPQNVMRA
jgi:hypothetical protein